MPVYTYRCDHCGVQFEQTQKFTDDPLTKCPECGKNSLHKVYTPVGIVFKGSGFYATDHRSPSGQSKTTAEKKEEKPAEVKAESSSSSESSTTKNTESAKPAPAPISN